MSQHKDHPLAAQRQLADLIGKDRFAMLTEPGTGELLESRPMTLLEFDAQGLLWFFCRRQADARPHPVNLAFSDEVHSTFVSIAGRAEQVDDRERIHALWTAAARPWFPDGPDSPDLALLKIVPLKVEYWDAPDSRVVRGLALAASILSGSPVGLGEHGVLGSVRSCAMRRRVAGCVGVSPAAGRRISSDSASSSPTPSCCARRKPKASASNSWRCDSSAPSRPSACATGSVVSGRTSPGMWWRYRPTRRSQCPSTRWPYSCDSSISRSPSASRAPSRASVSVIRRMSYSFGPDSRVLAPIAVHRRRRPWQPDAGNRPGIKVDPDCRS